MIREPDSFLLHGAGVTNLAVAAALLERGHSVVLTDDGDPEGLAAAVERIDPDNHLMDAGMVQTFSRPSPAVLRELLGDVDAVVPTPGLPESHPVFEVARAAEVPILSEFDLAGWWDERPVVAITGTNGKTTVTMLVTEMLEASGLHAVAVGNTDTPLVAALNDPTVEVFVVEASSFRLARSRVFRPAVSVWLNFAEDHLDVHRDLAAYRSAKARIWGDQRPSDLAIANADDPVVRAEVRTDADAPRVEFFGLGDHPDTTPHTTAHTTLAAIVSDGRLMVHGEDLLGVRDLWSQMPHDRANVLAAALAALGAGATLEGARAAATAFNGLSHRVELVAEIDGVAYYDDSKATAPHATLAALQGFDSVVLIAGGRNKGLDLGELAAARSKVRAVVGIGEAADEVVAAFDGIEASTASSMRDAVDAARSLASPGDVVLLSPACASFDWYESYAARGDDFVRHVKELEGVSP